MFFLYYGAVNIDNYFAGKSKALIINTIDVNGTLLTVQQERNVRNISLTSFTITSLPGHDCGRYRRYCFIFTNKCWDHLVLITILVYLLKWPRSTRGFIVFLQNLSIVLNTFFICFLFTHFYIYLINHFSNVDPLFLFASVL